MAHTLMPKEAYPRLVVQCSKVRTCQRRHIAQFSVGFPQTVFPETSSAFYGSSRPAFQISITNVNRLVIHGQGVAETSQRTHIAQLFSMVRCTKLSWELVWPSLKSYIYAPNHVF